MTLTILRRLFRATSPSVIGRIALLFVACSLLGCSGRPAALHPPDVDPSEAAASAIEQLDRNGDAKLSQDEWSASGALTSVAKEYDKDGNNILDEAELQSGIVSWQENVVGPRQVSFRIRLNGQPLAGATVKLVPAPFMDDEMKPASATTNAAGSGFLAMSPDDMPEHAPKMPLVQPGLYDIVITHPTKNIPAKYHSPTTLGIAITSNHPGPQGITWGLDGK